MRAVVPANSCAHKVRRARASYRATVVAGQLWRGGDAGAGSCSSEMVPGALSGSFVFALLRFDFFEER
jgi:hypothetical protein